MKDIVGRIVRSRNRTSFEKYVDLVYEVVDIYNIRVELWPYYDEKKLNEYEKIVVNELSELFPLPNGFFWSYVGISVPDEVYVSIDEFFEKFEVLSDDEVIELLKKDILPPSSDAYWRIKRNRLS